MLLAQDPATTGLSVLKEYGILVFLLLVILYGIWKVSIWLGKEILIPIRDGHLEFLKTSTVTQAGLAKDMRLTTEVQERIAATQEMTNGKLDDIYRKVDSVSKKLDGARVP